MKHLVILLFWTAIAISLAAGCRKTEDSSTVDQDRIYAYYELKYDEAKDQTFAYARFHFGENALGTPLELAAGSDVTVDGQTMTWNDLLNHYEKTFSGNKNSATFLFNDLDNNAYSNVATIRAIALAASTPDTLPRTASFDLNWTGGALAADEAVWVYAKGDGENDDKIFQTADIGATSISLAKDKLETIDDGDGKLWISRRYSIKASQGSSNGGDVVAVYVTAAKGVYFK